MVVLENHFDDEDTIIGLGYIQNGCQLFTIEATNEVFLKYGIPKEMQEEVLQILSEETNKEKTINPIQEYVKSDNALIRRFVARIGVKEHLDILVDDKDWVVRKEVAKHNHKDLLDILVNDNNWRVRREVAKHNHKDLLDILIDDEYWVVRNQAEQTLKEMSESLSGGGNS